MKYIKHTILPLVCALAFVGCSDDADDEVHDLQFCVSAVWENGFGTRSTRVDAGNGDSDNGYDNPTNGDPTNNNPTGNDPTNNGNDTYNPNFNSLAQYILAENRDRIIIPYEYYPNVVNLKCSDGTEFTISKEASICPKHNNYLSYTPSEIFRDKEVIRDKLIFEATAVADPIFGRPGDAAGPNNPVLMSDVLKGECNARNIDDGHIQLTLHHTKALVRFGFKVDEKYDKVRYVRITDIKLNDDINCVIINHVLTTNGTMIAYAYIDPTAVDWLSGDTQISCTYNIYDKDSADDAYAAAVTEHLTRKAVTAKNTFKFANLKKNGVGVSQIEAGYYYDVMVTINPDYLYVLAEHDDKHMKIE